MGLFRSETILHKKLRLPGEIESAVRVLDNLGNLPEESIEFIDLTHNDLETKKLFSPLIKRCDDLDAIVTSFEILCNQFKIKYFTYKNYDNFKADVTRDQEMRMIQNGAYFDVLESELIEQDRKINELLESYNKMKEDILIEKEKKIVYEKYKILIRSGVGYNNDNKSLAFIIGVAHAEDDIKMKRMIFRASRGTAIASFFDIEDEKKKEKKNTSTKIEKKIFVIFYPSEGKEILRGKLLKICDIFNASRYQPENDEDKDMVEQLRKSIEEKKSILRASRKEIKNYLYDISGTSLLPGKISLYKLYFKKMKMIYENLAKCIHNKNFIDGEVWVIEKHFNLIKRNLELSSNDSNFSSGAFINIVDSSLKKPTYIPSNEFTNPFQEIVNTYGIPRYQEVNPAYFNIVFFPFLFGMMFGDIGHGLILALVGLYLLLGNTKIRQNKKSIFNYLVDYRHIIFLMGFFAFFCGFLYNDFLGVPMPIFKSCYREGNVKKKGCTYPFGIDSKWYSSSNELSFINSIKMKLSVIFGVFQMIFGIVLKGLNDNYFKDYLSFFFEFIPQLIFMCLLFGYMIVLIFVKWNINWTTNKNPPSIITQMIDIFLKYGSVHNNPLWGGKTNNKPNSKFTQEQVQQIFLLVSLCMIPIMLLAKPLCIYCMRKKKKASQENILLLQNENAPLFEEENEEQQQLNHQRALNVDLDGHYSYLHKPQDNNEEINMVDILVHQLIETIEFVLGAVSNTASYLRLWALSLAHSQLSKVFLEKTLLNTFVKGDFYYGLNVIKLIICFFIFAHVTLFVLMFMDLLECFLHTLRLHWVEFQNKFYKADGYLFVPFSFKYLIRDNTIQP